MIRGNIGDCDLIISLVDNLSDEGEVLDGRARKLQKKQVVEVQLDSGLDGPSLLNTWLHETLHLCEYVYGWEARHEEVYMLASALSQALLTTGILTEAEFEARLRMLHERPEAEESK